MQNTLAAPVSQLCKILCGNPQFSYAPHSRLSHPDPFFTRIASIHRAEHEDPSRPQLWVSPFNSKSKDDDIKQDLWEHFSKCREDISWMTVHVSATKGFKHAYIAFDNLDGFRKGLGLDGSYMNGTMLVVKIANVSRPGRG